MCFVRFHRPFAPVPLMGVAGEFTRWLCFPRWWKTFSPSDTTTPEAFSALNRATYMCRPRAERRRVNPRIEGRATLVPGTQDPMPGHILIPAPVMPNSLCFAYTIGPRDGVHFPDCILARSWSQTATLNGFATAFALAGPLRNSACAYVSCQNHVKGARIKVARFHNATSLYLCQIKRVNRILGKLRAAGPASPSPHEDRISTRPVRVFRGEEVVARSRRSAENWPDPPRPILLVHPVPLASTRASSLTLLPATDGNEPASHSRDSGLILPARPGPPTRCG